MVKEFKRIDFEKYKPSVKNCRINEVWKLPVANRIFKLTLPHVQFKLTLPHSQVGQRHTLLAFSLLDSGTNSSAQLISKQFMLKIQKI